MLKLALAVAALTAAAVVAPGAAVAADPPAVGTTVTTVCQFDGHDGTTCRQQTVVVSAGGCFAAGYRLYSRDEIDSVRQYRGNAVLPGLDGATVDGGYGSAVRPHARLVYDSGPHAFGESFPVEDPTCA